MVSYTYLRYRQLKIAELQPHAQQKLGCHGVCHGLGASIFGEKDLVRARPLAIEATTETTFITCSTNTEFTI